MRPASPTSCDPVAVIAPVMGVGPSVNSGSCVLPAASAVAVVVVETDLTVELNDVELSTCSTVPELENCRFDPSAALSCATTERHAAGEIHPDHRSFGLVVAVSGQRQRRRVVDPTMVTVCGLLSASV